MMVIVAGQVACFALLLVAVHNPVAIAIMLFVSSAFGFGFSTPIQVRILHGAREAPRLAATLVSTAYNVGIAGGAALGAILLSYGMDYALLPAAGIVTGGIAVVVAAVSLRLDAKPTLAGAAA
jgi:DHA1 family inner membrane transport protein